jgi:hypothetical protein
MGKIRRICKQVQPDWAHLAFIPLSNAVIIFGIRPPTWRAATVLLSIFAVERLSRLGVRGEATGKIAPPPPTPLPRGERGDNPLDSGGAPDGHGPRSLRSNRYFH